MRKGHFSLLLYDFAYIMTFLRFQGEPSGFTSKNSILGGLRRKVEVRGRPGHQEQGRTRETGDVRPCIKAHGRAPKEKNNAGHQRSGTATPCLVARPCHHARVAVRPTHGRAWGGAARLNRFLRFFFGTLSFRLFFLVFPLCSRVRERLERVLKTLD